jgi:hypothetical protein
MKKRAAQGKGYISPNLTVTVDKWATPTANASKQEGDNINHQGRLDRGCLPSQAIVTRENWPTPVRSDFQERKPSENWDGSDLPSRASIWKTPTANEDAAGKPESNMQQMLKQQTEVETCNILTGRQDQVNKGDGKKLSENAQNLPPRWKTPTTMDQVTNRNLENQEATRDSLGNAELARKMMGEKRRLNPLFVEWLMGKPLFWSLPMPIELNAFKHWEMESCQLLERLHSGFCLKD